MRVASTLFIFSTGLCLSISSLLSSQNLSEWRQVIDKKNITVHVYHSQSQSSRAIKAIATLNLPIESVEQMLDRVEAYPSWQESVKDAKIVHRISEVRYHFYTRTHQGWPAKDRDLIWAVEKYWDAGSESLVYDQVCSTNTLPDNNNAGLATQAFVTWRLFPLGEHQTKITYTLTIQQGGRMPNWLIAMVSAEGPFQTLSNLSDLEIKGDGTTASMD